MMDDEKYDWVRANIIWLWITAILLGSFHLSD